MTINAAWGNGANAQATTVDLSGLTGFAAPSNLSGLESDGSAAGSISGCEIEKNGTLNVLFSTGGKISAGTIALSTFRNAGELQRVGSTKLAESSASGKPTVGRPQSDGRGSTVGGALENSTVDPTGEFVDMIRFQRAYQAGSQVIQTYSQLLNTTIQISWR